jgi:hypothetical protein
MRDARQTPAGRHVTAKVVVSMTETEYASWRSGWTPTRFDAMPRSEGEPEGWHVREMTEDGYPLMGSSPAERQEAKDRAARIQAQAMRGHRFVGDGPYCQGRISFAPIGSADTGWIVGWTGCGYPPDLHPEASALIGAR